jgi:hypothetical protein
MKVKKGDSSFEIKPYGEILAVRWFKNHYESMYPLIRVGRGELDQMMLGRNFQLQGRPRYFAMDGVKLIFWPSALEEGEIQVRYYPTVEEC